MNCLLVLQKCKESDKYSIHGLWFEKNSQEATCSIKATELPKKLLVRLEKTWYSCAHANNRFWQHEYCKHGKAYFSSAEEYFEATLRAYDFVKGGKELKGNQIKISLIFKENRFYYPFQLKF